MKRARRNRKSNRSSTLAGLVPSKLAIGLSVATLSAAVAPARASVTGNDDGEELARLLLAQTPEEGGEPGAEGDAPVAPVEAGDESNPSAEAEASDTPEQAGESEAPAAADGQAENGTDAEQTGEAEDPEGGQETEGEQAEGEEGEGQDGEEAEAEEEEAFGGIMPDEDAAPPDSTSFLLQPIAAPEGANAEMSDELARFQEALAAYSAEINEYSEDI
ncbi:MAG: hypothetical protein KC561_11945, partial [Myxococcales bacterium]|nr:hypothetical protein [Myxococcales bacterium]